MLKDEYGPILFDYIYIIYVIVLDKINLDDMCEINLQCSGTENAGVCGKNQTCTCDEGFIRSKEGCLPGKYVEDDHCQQSVPSNCYITFGWF